MYLLTNPIREYAWGSPVHIPKFLGREPTGQPAAELWMGAHDGDPSHLPDGMALNEAISADPDGMLGARVREMFGDRLPFLMKVLAAAEPLSLQVHPSSARAEIGFAQEEAAGVARDDGSRNYRDRWHKPEMLYALTRFEGMAGFRDVAMTSHLLRQLQLPWSDEVAARLHGGSPFQTLRTLVSDILAMRGESLVSLLQSVAVAAVAAEARGHHSEAVAAHPRNATRAGSIEREAIRVFALIPGLVERYPSDPGVLVTLLLNHVVLAPGEAMYLNAGVIHAYTSGLGLEIMASSDNVLRAGLTTKHTDVAELLHVSSFNPIPGPRWDPTASDGGSVLLEPPVDEFNLRVGLPAYLDLPHAGPRLILALEGQTTIATSEQRATLLRGQALFVPHSDGELTAAGAGKIAVGSVPL